MDTYLTARAITGLDNSKLEECLSAAQRGEAWALEALYHLHSARIYTLCHRILNRSEDAEDAMQSTFLKAFRQLTEFRGECRLSTWLFRIATNESLILLRTRVRLPESLDLETIGPGPDGTSVVQRRLAVRSSMEQMRSDHRIILILRYWEDLSHEEIASVLSISTPCVKMRLLRARREFRKIYGETP